MTSKAAKDGMVAQLCEFTGAITNDATRLLKAHKWQLPLAMDAFYSDAGAMRNAERAAQAASPQLLPRLTALFEKYAGGKGKDVIPIDGTLAWCSDLGVEPEDPVMLAVAELCKATEMGSFERKGWIDGWSKLKYEVSRCLRELWTRTSSRKDSIEGQRDAIRSLRTGMTGQADSFKRIYDFTFGYAKAAEQRSMPLDTAAPMWQLLLPIAPPSLFQPNSAWNPHEDAEGASAALERWIKFLTEENKARPVSKDIWSQFLDFAAIMDAQYSAFDADEAWPSLMDSFVEYEKDHPPTVQMEE